MKSARRYWMPDQATRSCTGCGTPFTFFTRRHHCRFCGKIYCNACSSQEMDGRVFGETGVVRVCDDCKRLERTAAATAGGGGLAPDASGAASDATSSRAAIVVLGGVNTRLASAPHSGPDAMSADAASGDTAARLAGAPAATVAEPEARLGIGIFDRRARLAPPVGAMFNAPATPAAEELFRCLAGVAEEHLEWLVRRAVSAYIPERRVAAGAAETPPDDGGGEGDRLGERQEQWVAALTRAVRRAAASIDPNIRDGDRSDARLYLKVKAVPLAPQPHPLLPVDAEDGAAAVDGAAAPGARAAVPPGPWCEVVDGVAFRRNLPHKGMRSDILSPRVVLLDDAITFEGGATSRLLSLETLLDQERRYTDILVSKVLALRPDVLIVSQTVSRIAQEMLLRGGVSVVANVRLRTLQRLSRATGARILPSVNYLDKVPEAEIVGVDARRFAVRTLDTTREWLDARQGGGGAGAARRVAAASGATRGAPDSEVGDAAPKPRPPPCIARAAYIVVDGAPPHRGCTVLVRGDARDLRAAKAILRHAVYAGRSLRLQTAFAFDAALPPPGGVAGPRCVHLPGAAAIVASLMAAAHSGGGPAVWDPALRAAALRWLASLPSSPNLDVWASSGRLRFGLENGAPWATAASPSAALVAADGCGSDVGLRALAPPGWAALLQRGDVVPDVLSATHASEGMLLASCRLLLAVGDGGSTSGGGGAMPGAAGAASAQQCFKPRLRLIRFNSPSDPSLGQYLEDSCLNDARVCRSCRKGPTAHAQTYFHARGRLDITVLRLAAPMTPAAAPPLDAPRVAAATAVAPAAPQPPQQLPAHSLPPSQPSPAADIVTWAHCGACRRPITPVTRLSRAAWSLSFGKFLALTFYAPAAAPGGASGLGGDAAAAQSCCPHAPQTSHVRFFARGRIAAAFRYLRIAPVTLVVHRAPPADDDVASADALAAARRVEADARLILEAATARTAALVSAVAQLQAVAAAALHVYGTCASAAAAARSRAVAAAASIRSRSPVVGGDSGASARMSIRSPAPLPLLLVAPPPTPAEPAVSGEFLKSPLLAAAAAFYPQPRESRRSQRNAQRREQQSAKSATAAAAAAASATGAEPGAAPPAPAPLLAAAAPLTTTMDSDGANSGDASSEPGSAAGTAGPTDASLESRQSSIALAADQRAPYQLHGLSSGGGVGSSAFAAPHATQHVHAPAAAVEPMTPAPDSNRSDASLGFVATPGGEVQAAVPNGPRDGAAIMPPDAHTPSAGAASKLTAAVPLDAVAAAPAPAAPLDVRQPPRPPVLSLQRVSDAVGVVRTAESPTAAIALVPGASSPAPLDSATAPTPAAMRRSRSREGGLTVDGVEASLAPSVAALAPFLDAESSIAVAADALTAVDSELASLPIALTSAHFVLADALGAGGGTLHSAGAVSDVLALHGLRRTWVLAIRSAEDKLAAAAGAMAKNAAIVGAAAAAVLPHVIALVGGAAAPVKPVSSVSGPRAPTPAARRRGSMVAPAAAPTTPRTPSRSFSSSSLAAPPTPEPPSVAPSADTMAAAAQLTASIHDALTEPPDDAAALLLAVDAAVDAATMMVDANEPPVIVQGRESPSVLPAATPTEARGPPSTLRLRRASVSASRRGSVAAPTPVRDGATGRARRSSYYERLATSSASNRAGRGATSPVVAGDSADGPLPDDPLVTEAATALTALRRMTAGGRTGDLAAQTSAPPLPPLSGRGARGAVAGGGAVGGAALAAGAGTTSTASPAAGSAAYGALAAAQAALVPDAASSHLYRGHLSLPPGLGGAVVPVSAELTSSIIAYSLCAELYWRKLVEIVDAAAARFAAQHQQHAHHQHHAAQHHHHAVAVAPRGAATAGSAAVGAAAAVVTAAMSSGDADGLRAGNAGLPFVGRHNRGSTANGAAPPARGTMSRITGVATSTVIGGMDEHGGIGEDEDEPLAVDEDEDEEDGHGSSAEGAAEDAGNEDEEEEDEDAGPDDGDSTAGADTATLVSLSIERGDGGDGSAAALTGGGQPVAAGEFTASVSLPPPRVPLSAASPPSAARTAFFGSAAAAVAAVAASHSPFHASSTASAHATFSIAVDPLVLTPPFSAEERRPPQLAAPLPTASAAPVVGADGVIIPSTEVADVDGGAAGPSARSSAEDLLAAVDAALGSVRSRTAVAAVRATTNTISGGFAADDAGDTGAARAESAVSRARSIAVMTDEDAADMALDEARRRAELAFAPAPPSAPPAIGASPHARSQSVNHGAPADASAAAPPPSAPPSSRTGGRLAHFADRVVGGGGLLAGVASAFSHASHGGAAPREPTSARQPRNDSSAGSSFSAMAPIAAMATDSASASATALLQYPVDERGDGASSAATPVDDGPVATPVGGGVGGAGGDDGNDGDTSSPTSAGDTFDGVASPTPVPAVAAVAAPVAPAADAAPIAVRSMQGTSRSAAMVKQRGGAGASLEADAAITMHREGVVDVAVAVSDARGGARPQGPTVPPSLRVSVSGVPQQGAPAVDVTARSAHAARDRASGATGPRREPPQSASAAAGGMQPQFSAAAPPPVPPQPRARVAGNFGVVLPLTPAAMLASDIRADIVHTFADKSSWTVGVAGATTATSAAAAAAVPLAGLATNPAVSASEFAPAHGSDADGPATAGTALAAIDAPPAAAAHHLQQQPQQLRPASFSVTSYWAMHFHALRELAADTHRSFVVALAACARWAASGGKSGARFERTADGRYVVKHVSRTEFDMFVGAIAPAYFVHLRGTLVDGAPSLLVRVLGAYKVVTTAHNVGGGAGRKTTAYLVVMDNLFHGASVPAGLKFDLKGKPRAQKRAAAPAWAAGAADALSAPRPAPLVGEAHNPFNPVAGLAPGGGAAEQPAARAAADGEIAAAPPRGGGAAIAVTAATAAPAPAPPPAPSTDDDLVLLDGDLLAYTRGLPLPLTEASKRLLDAAVRRDTDFLCRVNVVDYSVLVGLDPASGRMVAGVIDYIRRFDLAKQLESRVKTMTSLATNVEPTVIQPERYVERLQRAMDRYFVATPDYFA